MVPTGEPVIQDRYRDLYRRAAAIVQRHSFPLHETAAIHCAPAAGVTYQRGGIHYVVLDMRAVFGEILVMLDEAATPERAALRIARDRLAHGSIDADSAADALARIEAALAGPADPLREARPGEIDGWRSATRAKLERSAALADEGDPDEWWHGFASGLLEALNAHAAHVAHGRGICVASHRRHAALWCDWRARGEPIRSRWIDEESAEASERAASAHGPVEEAVECGVTLLYAAADDTRDHALVMAGAALAAGREVLIVGGSVPACLLHHPQVRFERSLADAFAETRRILGGGDPPPLPSWLTGLR